MTFPNQIFARATKLNPNIVIGGETYTHALKWDAANDDTILSGAVTSISGTTSKTIVCNRAFQTSSVTVNDATYGNFLKESPVLMGGNIVGRSEPWRLYNASNSANAFRGSDSGKLEIGHCIEYDGKRYLITGVGTSAPSTVAWQGTDPIANTALHTVETTAFRLDFPEVSGVTLELKDDATDVYADGGIAVEQTASPGTFTVLTRKIFNGDSDVYPNDAAIGAESYFYESGSGTVIVGTGTETTGTNYFAFYFWRGLDQTPSTGDTIIIEGAGEYASTTDDVARVLRECSDDTNYDVFVFNKGSNSYGVGSCEFRLTTDNNSPVCVLSWGNTGFTGATQRTTAGGASGTVTLSATPTFNGSNDAFLIRITRSGTGITMAYSENTTAPSYTTIATFTVSGLATLQTAYLGFSCEADEFIATGYLGATGFLYGDGGVLAVRQFVNLSITDLTMDVGLASTRPIDSVTNLSTGEEMTSSASPARDNYTTVTDGLRFYNESQGDRIRVLHDVELSSPATPGDAARITNTVNLATDASTTVSENLAHYHDTITVADPEDELGIVAGESFTGKLAVFSEEIDDLEFDRRGDKTTDWASVGASEYLSRAIGGWVLLHQDFTDAHDVDALCFRTNKKRMITNGSVHADSVNDLATGLESLENQWVRLGGVGGAAPESISGNMTSVGPTISTFSCSGGGVVIDGYMLGVKKIFSSSLFATMGAFGVTDFPYYDIPTDTIIYYNGYGDTSFRTNSNVDCGSLSYNTEDEGVLGGLVLIKKNQTTDNFIGSVIESASYFGNAIDTSFDISGVGFGDNGVLRMMDSLGAECVEAKACVKFENLEYNYFTYEHVLDFIEVPTVGFSPQNGSNYVVINDVVVLDVLYSSGSFVRNNSASTPSPFTSGPVGFRLMGRRRNTGNIYIPRFDQFREYDSGIYKSYSKGNITSSNVESGKWSSIDITSAIKEALEFQTSDDQDLFFWPTIAGASPSTSDDGLASFIEGIRPEQTVEVLGRQSGGEFIVKHSGGSSNISFDSFQIRDVVARFRLPSGAITNPVPIIRKATI